MKQMRRQEALFGKKVRTIKKAPPKIPMGRALLNIKLFNYFRKETGFHMLNKSVT